MTLEHERLAAGLRKYLSAVLVSQDERTIYSRYNGCIVRGLSVENDSRTWVLLEGAPGSQVAGHYLRHATGGGGLYSEGLLEGRLTSFPMAHGKEYKPVFYFLGCPLREKFLTEQGTL